MLDDMRRDRKPGGGDPSRMRRVPRIRFLGVSGSRFGYDGIMKTTRRRLKREGSRWARAVLRDHLQRRKRNDLEGDLKRNYSDDVVVITKDADGSFISGGAQSGRLCSRAKTLPLSTGGRKVSAAVARLATRSSVTP